MNYRWVGGLNSHRESRFDFKSIDAPLFIGQHCRSIRNASTQIILSAGVNVLENLGDAGDSPGKIDINEKFKDLIIRKTWNH